MPVAVDRTSHMKRKAILKMENCIILTSTGTKLMNRTMMNNRCFTFVALAVAALAASCASDDQAEQKQGEPKTVELIASLNGGKSTAKRVGMAMGDNSNASFYWHKGEAILVQTKSGGTYSGTEFTTDAETGSASATFKGTVAAGSELGTYAVYPYSANHKFTSATNLTYNLPAAYTYSKVESNIFSKTENAVTTYPANNTNIPLVGNIADGKIAFKHIGGLAVIRIDRMPAAEGTLKITANEQLSGDFSCDLSASQPVITTTTASGNNTVTFAFSNATQNAAGVFYLPLATGSYSGVKIEVAYGSATQTVNYGNLYVPRAGVTAVPLYTINGKLEKFSEINGNVYTLNGRKFIDLGLPGGLLWAVTNIGADSETDKGKYYAWGEVTAYNEATDWGSKATKTSYTLANYKFVVNSTYTKYTGTDGKTTLEAEDDAATRNWGNGCRMPTKVEIDQLTSSDNCTTAWTTVNSVSGYKVTGKKQGYTGNSIFLPASGYCHNEQNCEHQGYRGYYWSSTLGTNSNISAYYIYFHSNGLITSYFNDRYYGMSVRPVTER